MPNDSVYDTVISTTTWAQAQGGVNGVVQSAANAAAQAALSAAVRGSASGTIAADARNAAYGEWQNVTGSAAGFEAHWPGINDRIVSTLQRYTPAMLIGSMSPASSVSEFAAANAINVAKSAVSAAAPFSLGAIVGGTTGLLIGGGILLLVLLKR